MKLLNGDCLELLKEIEPGSVDMVLADLPYGTTQSKWDTVIPFAALWEAIHTVCKPNAAVVMFAGQPFSSALVMSNVENFKYEWVWVKSKITGVLNAKRMPVRKHEQILVFGEKTNYFPQGLVPHNQITKQGGNSDNYGERNKTEYVQEFTNWPRDVLEFKSEGKTVHPTQKPVELLEYLIKTYTDEGDTVLDPTMGSGSTGVACKNTGRKFIGIEKESKYFDLAKERILRKEPGLIKTFAQQVEVKE